MSVADKLAAGPARGLGCANAVAAQALRSSAIVAELVAALDDERPVAVLRAANALKKVQQQRPEMLAPYAKRLLRAALVCEVLFARWSLTIIVGSLPLRGKDRALAIDLLFEALCSDSALLRTFAMQSLADMARDDAALGRRVRPVVEEFAQNGTAAMRARAQKLLAVGSF